MWPSTAVQLLLVAFDWCVCFVHWYLYCVVLVLGVFVKKFTRSSQLLFVNNNKKGTAAC